MSTITVEMTARELGLWRAQQKIIDQQVRMETGYRQVGGAAGRAGREGQQAGQRATSGWATEPLKQFAAVLGGVAGGLTIAGAFRTVINLARDAQEEIKGVGAELRGTAEGMKYLWQVSEGKTGYEQLAGKYKLAMAREGIARPAAQDLVFQLKSFGEMEAFDAVTKAHRFMKADVAAEYIARLRAPTAWGKEIATPEQALAGLVAGAEKSGFNVDVTADWFARVAAQARSMGATPAEVLGVGAAVSPSFTQGELQATAMRRLVSDLATWRDKTLIGAEQDRRDVKLAKKAEAIRGTEGLLATFDLYRQLEPTQYQLKKAENVRFRQIAESLEGARETAEQLTAEIAQQFRTGGAYRAKIAERPPELTIQQRAELAAVQKSVAMEPMALKQTQLETLIEQNKAIAAVSGRPITIEKGWEKALQAGATIGKIDEAIQAAATRLLRSIEEASPEVAKRFLQPMFRKEAPGVLGGMQWYSADVRARMVAPKQLLPEQSAAIAGAMTAIMEREISRRPAREEEREQRGREAQDVQRIGRAAGPLQVIHESLEQGVPLEEALAGKGKIPEALRRRFSRGPDYWGEIPPGPGRPTSPAQTVRVEGGRELQQAAEEFRQSMREATDEFRAGMQETVESFKGAADNGIPILGGIPGEDR